MERAARVVPALVGLAVLAVVVMVYVRARVHGVWPASHPWSGISLIVLAGLLLVPPAPHRSRNLRLVVASLAATSAVLWGFFGQGS